VGAIGHHEHRQPMTRLPAEASGWRSFPRAAVFVVNYRNQLVF
jgi:hypothetical protein